MNMGNGQSIKVDIAKKAKILREAIGMSAYPVGVKFVLQKDAETFGGFIKNNSDIERLHRYRYCQAVMEARHGRHVILDGKEISCPAAAAAFGFRSLPKGLENGKGLVGFGITKSEDVGIEMFKGMESIATGELSLLYLFPLETAVIEPDVVIMEDKVEGLMWVVLAYVNIKNGKRLNSSTAVLQATCVDSTIIPYKQHKMNLSFGCYGCRDATDIDTGESVLGFPYSDFDGIVDHVEYLSRKAIPNSRNKNAYILLRRKKAEEVLSSDIFKE